MLPDYWDVIMVIGGITFVVVILYLYWYIPIRAILEGKNEPRISLDRMSYFISTIPIIFFSRSYYTYTSGKVVIFNVSLILEVLIIILVSFKFNYRQKGYYNHPEHNCKICGNSKIMWGTEGHCSSRCYAASNRWALFVFYMVFLLIASIALVEFSENDVSKVYYALLVLTVIILTIPPLISFYVDTDNLRSRFQNKFYEESENRRKKYLYPVEEFEKSTDWGSQKEEVLEIKNYYNLLFTLKSSIKITIVEIAFGFMVGSRGLAKQRRSMAMEIFNFFDGSKESDVPEYLIKTTLFLSYLILLNFVIALIVSYLINKPKIRFCMGDNRYVDLLVTQVVDSYDLKNSPDLVFLFPIESDVGLIRKFIGVYKIEMPLKIPETKFLRMRDMKFADNRYFPFEPRHIYVKFKLVRLTVTIFFVVVLVILYLAAFILIVNLTFWT